MGWAGRWHNAFLFGPYRSTKASQAAWSMGIWRKRPNNVGLVCDLSSLGMARPLFEAKPLPSGGAAKPIRPPTASGPEPDRVSGSPPFSNVRIEPVLIHAAKPGSG